MINILKKSCISNIFQLPMRVYVPVVSHDKSLLPTLKFSISGKKWRSGKSLPEIHIPKFKVSEIIPGCLGVCKKKNIATSKQGNHIKVKMFTTWRRKCCKVYLTRSNIERTFKLSLC